MADQRFHLTNLHPMRTRIPEETQGISRSGNGTPLGSRLRGPIWTNLRCWWTSTFTCPATSSVH